MRYNLEIKKIWFNFTYLILKSSKEIIKIAPNPIKTATFSWLKKNNIYAKRELHKWIDFLSNSFLKDKLSPIEMPKQVEFRNELPKTLIGKLSKKELIAEEASKRANESPS